MKLPVLHIRLPRNVTAVHQIEITTRCNLKCVYCPSPQIVAGHFPGRDARDMTRSDFEASLNWVRHYVRQGTQRELNLAGIGESTIHPEFADFVRLAREAVGPDVKLIFATNGLHCPEELIAAVRPHNPRVWVSLHRPEKAAIAVERWGQAGLLDGISVDPSVNAYDWARQVKWHNTIRAMPLACQWIREGKIYVRSDGYFATCCVDAGDKGLLYSDIGNVSTMKHKIHVTHPISVDALQTAPYSLCASCTQEIGVAGYNQRGVSGA